MRKKQDVVPQHTHGDLGIVIAQRGAHHADHETGGIDAITALAGGVITSGTVDGDRLPAISTTKKGAVPAISAASPSTFLKDTGSFARVVQADVSGLETTATPQFAGLGIKTAGSDNKINLIEGAQIGVHDGPRQVFNDASKLLELLEADVNIGSTPTVPGTGGTWSTSYDSDQDDLVKSCVFLGKLFVTNQWGTHAKIYMLSAGSWTEVLSVASGVGFYAIGVHNDLIFASVAVTGNIWSSATGELGSWAIVGVPTANPASSFLSNGSTLWLSMGQGGGLVYYSANDGVAWTLSLTANPAGNNSKGLVYFDNNIHVGVNESSIGATRAWIYKYDGVSWSIVYTDAGPQYFQCSIVWNGKCYFGGSTGRIYVSSGSTFVLNNTLATSAQVYAFIEYNAKLLACCSDHIYETSDGVTWTEFYDTTETTVWGLAFYGNNLYAMTGALGKVLVYTDTTYVPAPKLTAFGHAVVHGQFRPGDFAGAVDEQLCSDAPDFPKWRNRAYCHKLNVTVQTANYTVLENDELVVCNSASAFTVTIPTATGSGRPLHIKNVNAGAITVSKAGDTIDGLASQTVAMWGCMSIADYAANKWGII